METIMVNNKVLKRQKILACIAEGQIKQIQATDVIFHS